MILFFDLDGPLLDVAPRYVALHHDLLGEHHTRGMDPHRYWSAKRARRSEEDILAELGASDLAAQYLPARLAKIESADYLSFDRCWPWALDCLRLLQRHATLVLVTVRADRSALLHQLEALELRRHFHEILSEAGGARVDRQKAALIRDYIARHDAPISGHWMIGDTEADILAGKSVGLRTIAVLSGIRDEPHLRQAAPDFLVADIRDVPTLLQLPPET